MEEPPETAVSNVDESSPAFHHPSIQMIDKKMDPSSTVIPLYRASNSSSSSSSSSFSWFEIRLFSIRISPCTPDMVPSYVSLSHPRRETGVSLEINGKRFPSSDPTSIILRLDRLNQSASEVTYVSTDSVRFTGPIEFEVRDSNELVLCGAFDRLDPSWINDTVRHDKDSKTGWCMDCYCAAGVAASSFVQPKKGITTPFMEVYVAGSCSGRPLILTQMVQVNPRKAIKQGVLDVILEDEDDDARTDSGQCVVRRSPVHPLVEGGDSDGYDSEMKFEHGLYADGQFYDEDGELTWFNSGVRVGVGIGLGMCLGVGIGVGLLMNSYQATARNLRRRFL